MSALLEVLGACGQIFDDSFTVADLKTKDEPLVFVNESFLRLTGYSKEEVLGKNCRFLQGEATDKVVTKRLRESINNRESCYYDVLNYKKNGTPFWNRLALIPITHQDEPRFYIGIQQDITKQKELNLGAPIDKFITQGQSTNEVARYINNPLLSIINSSRTLQYLSTGHDPQMLKEIVETMKTEVASISNYVKSL